MKKKNHNLIGNDIVDLLDSDCQDILDNNRVIFRVLNSLEMKMVLNSENPFRAYWRIWAAKEATFKAISRRFPKILFVPKKFKVSEDFSCVSYKTARFFLKIEETDNYIHALCAFKEFQFGMIKHWISPKQLLIRNNPHRINEETSQSKMVRFQLLWKLMSIFPKSAESDFLFQTESITGQPNVFYLNALGDTSLPVSFSHHGNYLASAVYLDTGMLS